MKNPRGYPRRFQHGNRPKRRLDAGSVAVVGQDNLIGIALQKTGMLGGKSRSQGSHRILKACLVHGNHIHVALADQHALFPGRPGHVQAIEIPALVEDCRLRGVQIFRFSISHDTAAEADDPVVHVHDRKNDTVPEFIVHTVSLIHIHKPGFPKKFVGDTLLFQIKIQVVAVFVGIAKAKAPDCLVGEASVFQVFHGLAAVLRPKLVIIVFCRHLVHIQDASPKILCPSFLLGVFFLRKCDASPLCQKFHSFRERIILVLLNKRKYVSTRPAAETVIHLLIRTYGKGGRFLVVEGAEPEVGASLPLEFYIFGNDTDDVIP